MMPSALLHQLQDDEMRSLNGRMPKETILGSDSIELFQLSILGNGGSKNSAAAYRKDLLGLLLWAEKNLRIWSDLDQMSKAWLNAHRETWKPNTLARRKAAIRSYARWSDQTALDVYRLPVGPPPEPHPIPGGIGAVEAVLAACPGLPERALVGLCGLMGLRIAEALATLASAVTFTDEGPTLLVNGKGSKQRRIPMSPKAAGNILPGLYLGPFTMSYSGARNLFPKLSQLAGIGHHSSHDFRATAATAFYENSGHDIQATRLFLGHASVVTTQTYVGTTSQTLRNGANF